MDRLLYAFSVFVVPALIAAGTVATLLWAPHQFESNGAVPLALRVVKDTGGTLDPAGALKALEHQAKVGRFSTQLAETPIWFSFDVPNMSQEQSSYVELPSRHAQTLSCWIASTLQPLGTASRQEIGRAHV